MPRTRQKQRRHAADSRKIVVVDRVDSSGIGYDRARIVAMFLQKSAQRIDAAREPPAFSFSLCDLVKRRAPPARSAAKATALAARDPHRSADTDQRSPKLIYVILAGQNPTGTIMSEQTRRSLLELADSFHCLIVEDDPWSELHYTATVPPSICSMDQNGQVIYLKGYSKVMAPGLRIGCLVARGSVFLRLANVKAIADLATPLFNQALRFCAD
ncbi:aminotransferase class I/II-fold pyridoxal phosphate-dependent enzyme [Brevibacillus parabrevis]|uniref:aminotransferase class I/II-fold pyridoxal phosphate-dependent enzyme n=1 Tax=Brevibacillus parabrevis TaxID=54914 RepID=UPI0028D04920|nr:aminotransferase class I/II-fold pyridoxal phosphate-dependent enzyme [Brevibacillus parabrevis]